MKGGLVTNSLVYRYNVTATSDGLEGSEGTFNMVSSGFNLKDRTVQKRSPKFNHLAKLTLNIVLCSFINLSIAKQCTFWLIEALARAGAKNPKRLREAQLKFEEMLTYANHLGLYAEQTGYSGRALGNFPQAFTHLALISSAFNLDKRLG